MKMREDIGTFIESLSAGTFEIYNEFSLQHELGIFLRGLNPDKMIQFERNVSYFGLDKSNFIKKEIDLSIFSSDKELHSVIELKYPRNGQVPEQMYSFCKDIAFLEQLTTAGFSSGYFLAVVDDPLFYSGDADNIYAYFRSNECLTGIIRKPTGKKDQVVEIQGRYSINWNPVSGKTKYCLVEIGS